MWDLEMSHITYTEYVCVIRCRGGTHVRRYDVTVDISLDHNTVYMAYITVMAQ